MHSTIIKIKSQDILPKLADRMNWKMEIQPYIIKMYQNRAEKKDFEEIKKREFNKIKNFKECGTNIWLDENKKITGANFCKQRLCPICNFRRSSMMWHKINEITNYVPDMQFIFITLTVKNCNGENLSSTIDTILQGFRRISNRKKWKRAITGTVRGLEITYNSKNNTFHPHLHILAAVQKDYFSSKNYIDFDELRKWWEVSCKLPYHASVDIKKVENKENAVAEVAKYAVKMADVLSKGISSQTIKATKILLEAIENRRLIATTGELLKIARKLKINLDENELEEIKEKRYSSKLWIWKNGKYEMEK